MIKVEKKDQCCGCSACESICSFKAIRMEKDSEGFFYPIVDIDRCVNCGLCEKVCPIINKKDYSTINEVYAIQLKDKKELFDCASGGAFTGFAQDIIESGGYVFGATYDEDMNVVHIKSNNIKDIYRFKSSKYVQSNPLSCYIDCKTLLDEGKVVLYSGTPCQIYGLKSYLRKEYDNLFTIDLVCKGVSSPVVFEKYLEEIKNHSNDDISWINFKRKTYGYHSSTMAIDFKKKNTYIKGGITDPMMRSFRKNICLRMSCYKCNFKGLKRASDITIFDCWHFGTLTQVKDNDLGYSNVIIHSEKGKKIFNESNKFYKYRINDLNKVINLDGIMINKSITMHHNRPFFIEDVKEYGLKKSIKKYIPITAKDRFKDRIKFILYKTKLLKIAKKIFK